MKPTGPKDEVRHLNEEYPTPPGTLGFNSVRVPVGPFSDQNPTCPFPFGGIPLGHRRLPNPRWHEGGLSGSFEIGDTR